MNQEQLDLDQHGNNLDLEAQTLTVQQQKEIDDKQIEIYKQCIRDGELTIKNNKVKDLSLIDTVNVHKLELDCFENVVPEFTSKTLKDLTIIINEIENFRNIKLVNLETLEIRYAKIKECHYFAQVKKLTLYNVKNVQQLFSNQICKNIQELVIEDGCFTSLDAFQLENVQVLHLIENNGKSLNLQNITMYQHLREFYLKGYSNVDTTILQELKNLHKVIFNECNNITINFNSENIKDFQLENCTIKCIGSFQPKKLENLDMLNLYKYADISLFKFQIQVQLEKLNLSRCGIVRLDFLSNLIHLKELDLSRNALNCDDGLSPLQYLVRLEKLNLSNQNRKLQNINGLSFLTNLKELDLSKNTFNDLTPLQYLLKLTKLNLESCHFTKNTALQSLQSLVNLEELNLSSIVYTFVNDQLCIFYIPLIKLPLYNLNKLSVLKLKKYVEIEIIPDIKEYPVMSFKDERDYYTYVFQTCNLTKLQQLSELSILDLSDCQLLNINSLTTLPIKELILDENPNIDITPIYHLTELQILSLINCKLLNVGALKMLVNLKELDLSQNPNINITPLQYLTKLTKLQLKQCKLLSVEALIPLQQLQYLNMEIHNLVYVEPLKQLKKLTIIEHFFDVDSHERRPTKTQILYANILRDINYPITLLRNINGKRIQLKNNMQLGKNSVSKISNNFLANFILVTQKFIQSLEQLNAETCQ
ncbi:leucine-rich_repeat domain-containing protein [Hexamita inflata]|uniref:Leucine-rich repeat domain-containing protein n=1 Tax=Hexamita inflata TaxID=28002 RepID=A0AA86P5B6_9EUKA|nr:leucine-rich repeat domain-containing protein [Hexamita inflata]